jgi:hypothetical protein
MNCSFVIEGCELTVPTKGCGAGKDEKIDGVGIGCGIGCSVGRGPCVTGVAASNEGNLLCPPNAVLIKLDVEGI